VVVVVTLFASSVEGFVSSSSKVTPQQCAPSSYLTLTPCSSRRSSRRRTASALHSVKKSSNKDASARMLSTITSSPARSAAFSALMTASGAALGPFLDSFHSAFGVLQYDAPITATLWGINAQHPALITAWWVPELFGLAGFLIGWLYILLDVYFVSDPQERTKLQSPSVPKICLGISIFTFQYWISGILYQSGVDRTTILNLMSVAAASGFLLLDQSLAGFLTSAATALGGPLIEAGLLTLSRYDIFFHGTGYHYTDPGETGFFPLWIIPVYFLGGPANGNLARGYWTALSKALYIKENDVDETTEPKDPPGCTVCGDTRRTPCPNW
jgi:hypothetical protein